MRWPMREMAVIWFFVVAAPTSDRVFRDLEVLAEIVEHVSQNKTLEVSGDVLMDGAVQGLLDQLDPHSAYYNAPRYRTMREDQRGSFFGIGIHIGVQGENVTVVAPLAGTPAARAGLRAGDVIEAIDGVTVHGKDLYDAIGLLRGEKGKRVRLTIRRPGLDGPLDLSMERAEIPTNNVRSAFMLNDRSGYVALKDFGETASEEVVTAIKNLEAQGMQQLVFDLRGNPGGLLPQAVAVAGLFLPDQRVVVSTQGRMAGSCQEYVSQPRSPITQCPLVVLIDRGSASASEIVSGAIQDHDRGLVVGITSWGKGLVQSVFPLGDGSCGLALTTARYYTPSGRNIQGSYESFDDYYGEEPDEDLFFKGLGTGTPSVPIMKTEHGRKVYQVRGILPDVYVAYAETPQAIENLELAENRFFGFAVRHQESLADAQQDWHVDDLMLKQFMDFLRDQGIEIDNNFLRQYRALIKEKLTYQFLFIQDADLAWKYLMRHDRHVATALELFPKAAELLDVFKGRKPLRSEYDAELRAYALDLREPSRLLR